MGIWRDGGRPGRPPVATDQSAGKSMLERLRGSGGKSDGCRIGHEVVSDHATVGGLAKRVFDCALAILLSLPLFVPLLVIAIVVKFSSRGPVLYWSDRVGRNNVIFRMPKFRTMKINTPEVATHLLGSAETWLTLP